MLYFYAVALEEDMSRFRREGLPAGAPLFASLEEARRQGSGPVLVVETEGRPEPGETPLPPSAFANLAPYRSPEPVVAAGGYVLRTGEHGEALATRQLLLIRKRNAWDLPKGKQDPGEGVRTCALREVREETGLGEVRALGALGSTVHGYAEERDGEARYCVKTTHWFLMETPEAGLTPERSEGIEEAAWVSWSEAGSRLGYETLRRHHRQSESQVQEMLSQNR